MIPSPIFFNALILLLEGISTASTLSKCPSPTPYQIKTPPLTTNWTDKVGVSPWPEYPRPLLRRRNWLNLNGRWQFKPANGSQEIENPPFGGCGFDREILVPFPMESGLSGIMETHLFSWYRKTFLIPLDWLEEVTLNFGAVDYESTIFVNGKQVGFHRGGYFKFSLDVTSALNAPGQENELLVFVYDPTNSKGTLIPVGKQVLKPDHIFYTPSSGIWQTVFLEPVPKEHIKNIDTTAHADGSVKIHVSTSNPSSNSPLKITLYKPIISDSDTPLYPDFRRTTPIFQADGNANTPVSFSLPSPRLWSPNDPNLYHFEIKLGNDLVQSYLGFRTIEKKKDHDGVVRPFLNGEFIFQLGTLDQGFWPDGIHTAPTLEAMEYDMQVLKELGFNAIRKHIKIEPDLYYYASDRIGLLVWQDMPAMNPNLPWPTPDQQQEFVRQLKLMLTTHLSFPSIITWLIYNEGWGQLGSSPEIELTPMLKQIDPTRLVISVSGWRDAGAGDFHDNHHYPYPQCGTPFYSLPSTPYDPRRIAIQGEYGGIGHIPSLENLWNVQSQLDTLNQTYEIASNLEIWNYRATRMLQDLRDQTELFSCSGGIYTQTTDVEGETNGLLTYDRRILRPALPRFQEVVASIYKAAENRTAANATIASKSASKLHPARKPPAAHKPRGPSH